MLWGEREGGEREGERERKKPVDANSVSLEKRSFGPHEVLFSSRVEK